MSDMLGDRRFIASLDSVSSFSNFDFLYLDLHHRTNWGVRVFDNRSFFTTPSIATATSRSTGSSSIARPARSASSAIPSTAITASTSAPATRARDINYPFLDDRPADLFFFERRDNFPFVTATLQRRHDVVQGVRPDLRPPLRHRHAVRAERPRVKQRGSGGRLTNDYTLDARQYLPITSRALLAARLFAGYSRGNFPNFYYFGGLNTCAATTSARIIGNRAAFANLEFRFPLIDVLATPIVVFQQDPRQSLLRHRRREFHGPAVQVQQEPPPGRRRGLRRLRHLVQFARPGAALGFRQAHRPPATSTASTGRSSGSARCSKPANAGGAGSRRRLFFSRGKASERNGGGALGNQRRRPCRLRRLRVCRR